MATTVENSTLTVRITEQIDLNGRKLGNTNTHKIKNINEVSERVITALTSGTQLITLGAAAGAGAFIRDNVKYIRLTNLDDTNYLRLAFTTDSDPVTALHVKLTALDSFIIHNGSANTVIDGSAVTFNNITSIKAWANSASVDVEVFVASS